jgi:FkbM family methyltransferase
MNEYSFAKKLIFWFSWNGFRGSHLLWKFVKPNLQRLTVVTPNGFPFFVNDDDWICRTIKQGTYERPLLHLLDKLQPSELVIDIGANLGITLFHTIKGGKKECLSLAFEPLSENLRSIELVKSHLKANCIILPYAVGAKNFQSNLYGVENELHSGGASLRKHKAHNSSERIVEVVTLDSYLENLPTDRGVSLLKIDVEGYEAEVLFGASHLIHSRRIELLIIEVSPNFGETSYLNKLFDDLGPSYVWYELFESGNFQRTPKLRKIEVEEAIAKSYQFNLCIFRTDALDMIFGKKVNSSKVIKI